MKQEEKRIKGKRWVMMLVACIILSCAGSAALCASAEEYPLPEGTTTPGSTQSESSVGAAQEEELHAVTREEAIALAKTPLRRRTVSRRAGWTALRSTPYRIPPWSTQTICAGT